MFHEGAAYVGSDGAVIVRRSVKMRAHKEAFALMWYACKCGHRERIWNSRDGVTPFGGILCISCGGGGLKGGLSHVDFHLDEPAPDHQLRDGQLFFRDGTAEDAVKIIERRIVHFADAGKPIPDDIAEMFRQHAREQTNEWHEGWPMVERYRAPETSPAQSNDDRTAGSTDTPLS